MHADGEESPRMTYEERSSMGKFLRSMFAKTFDELPWTADHEVRNIIQLPIFCHFLN